MNTLPRRSFPTLLSVAVLGLTLWIGGCDATRIDQGADVSLEAHLAALSSADTPDKAESALRGIFNKVGIRTAWQGNVAIDAHPYGLYSVTDDEISALAERQAKFVNGQRDGASSYRSTHDAVLDADAQAFEIVRNLSTGLAPITRPAVTIDADNALKILRAQARTSLSAPEAQTSAIVLAAATSSLDAIPVLSPSDVISPAQEFLYSIWLHRNGPLMYDFSETSARAASQATNVGVQVAASCFGPDCEGDLTSCDPCCDGTGKFTDVTFQYLGDSPADVEVTLTQPASHINGFVPFPTATVNPGEIIYVSAAGRTNAPPGFVGTLGNEIAIFVDGNEIDYAPYGDPDNPDADTNGIHTSCSELVLPGDMYGDFLVVAVATQTNGLCSSLSTCVGACQTQLNSCLVAANGDANQEAKCQAQFVACDQNCHDQGGVNP